MLTLLNIVNLAVIRELQIEFGDGLNILTGETGAGKSIILEAVELLIGAKATGELIRTGESRALVEGRFGIGGNEPLIALLEAAGIDPSGDELIIRREVMTGGRGRTFINNQGTTNALLREIGPHLVDIHGQGEQQSLLTPEAQLRLLDAYGGGNELRGEVGDLYDGLRRAVEELEDERRGEEERRREAELIEHQIAEIEAISPQGEEEEQRLEREEHLLRNAERRLMLCGSLYGLLYEDEGAITERLSTALRQLQELSSLDPGLEAAVEGLLSARYAIDDLALSLRAYADGIEVSSARLREVEARRGELDRLKRKYGGAIETVLASLAEMRARREAWEEGADRRARREDELRRRLEKYRDAAAKLGKLRRSSASRLEQAIIGELEEVALERAQFEVRLTPASREGMIERARASGVAVGGLERGARWGLERAEYHFTANEGEELKPLTGVASGGELSRLMLVLKNITAPTLFPRTLIFDEIDTGIGGRVAEAVGARLKRLAGTNQVLCVTHQAQIARYADAHYRVAKSREGRRTMTRVERLERRGRIEELARMLAGSEISSLARRHARELLQTGV